MPRAQRTPQRTPSNAARIAAHAYVLALLGACGPGEAEPSGSQATATQATGSGSQTGGATDAVANIRNVLFVVIDTLRADHVGAHGYPLDTTPRLDALAARGALFEQAMAPSSWTRASMAAVLTGLHPTAAGLTEHNFRLPKADGDVLPESVDSLAELLAEAGLATHAVVANINVDPVFGFDQGFDSFEVVSGKHAATDADWRLHDALMHDTTDDVTASALQLLEAHAADGQDFLLWLQYLDPHDPYEPPEPQRSAFVEPGATITPLSRDEIPLYDAELASVDASFGTVLDALRDQGLADQTAVVVISDHGEEFLEHGATRHGWSLFDEQLHVPLVLVAPGLVEPGARVSTQVRTLDVLPTLLELLGHTPPDGLTGRSLLPLLRGDEHEHRPAFAERSYRPLVALREPPWKLIVDVETGSSRLYDIEADPGETVDRRDEQPDVHADMLRRVLDLRAQAERDRPRTAGGDVQLSDEQRERLRALGYVGEDDEGR